ncbi:MAG: PLP-dependent aminotransferase family protein [Actinomycetia bacterium]|nr:PLP-dependent aminotransferase family protein [Actinomycetes bacterium]MCP4086873.1 PLP-dependent aminotransferase family protein [Actinomycetes bacterium]
MSFDMTALFRPDLPAAGGRWGGYPEYSFVGGHNDGDNVPFGGLSEAAVSVLRREGSSLASYNVGGSPQGYAPLREFIAGSLESRASTPTDPEDVLVVSGSLQALDLVNGVLLESGDTVIVEMATYGGMIARLQRLGVEVVGVHLDDDGIRSDHLGELLSDMAARGVKPKYIYTIPTVQNPTGSVMPVERRLEVLALAREHGVAIFEDDCYADLVFDGSRPPTFRALDDGGGQVVYCGSFSKSIAPALRVGYLVADWAVLGQMMALKNDAGTGAIEQMVLAEYASSHFDDHVRQLASVLEGKCRAMTDAVTASFGDAASFTMPKGGIFVWVTFAEGVNTGRLAKPALEAGVEFNPGAGWSADREWGRRRLRLCFGHPSVETIRQGVGVLADVFRDQGVI